MTEMESILTFNTKGGWRKWCNPKVSIFPASPPGKLSSSSLLSCLPGGAQVLFCSITTFFLRESDKHMHTKLQAAINSASGIVF